MTRSMKRPHIGNTIAAAFTLLCMTHLVSSTQAWAKHIERWNKKTQKWENVTISKDEEIKVGDRIAVVSKDGRPTGEYQFYSTRHTTFDEIVEYRTLYGGGPHIVKKADLKSAVEKSLEHSPSFTKVDLSPPTPWDDRQPYLSKDEAEAQKKLPGAVIAYQQRMKKKEELGKISPDVQINGRGEFIRSPDRNQEIQQRIAKEKKEENEREKELIRTGKMTNELDPTHKQKIAQLGDIDERLSKITARLVTIDRLLESKSSKNLDQLQEERKELEKGLAKLEKERNGIFPQKSASREVLKIEPANPEQEPKSDSRSRNVPSNLSLKNFNNNPDCSERTLKPVGHLFKIGPSLDALNKFIFSRPKHSYELNNLK